MLIVLVALLLAAPAQAGQLTKPDGYVAAQPHASSISAQLELKGRVRRRAVVEIRTRCEVTVCTTTTVADRRGRYEALLDVVVPHGRRNIRIRVNDDAWTLPLDLPDYAAFPPYVDDAAAPELNVIGDSLATGTDAPLRAALPGWRVTTDSRVSRPLAAGMSVLAMTLLPDRPRALAFSLFTNDDPRNVDALEEAVRTSLDRLHERDCALWATIARPKLAGVSYRSANLRLASLAVADDRLRIVDWARAVKRHPEWLRDDRVHPTPAGYAARARMFARAAQACAVDNGWDQALSRRR